MAAMRIEGKLQRPEGYGAVAASSAAACCRGQEYFGETARLMPHNRRFPEEGVQGSFDFGEAEGPVAGDRADGTTATREPGPYYRIIAETITEGALILSSRGTILYCNRGFSRMVDTRPAELVGSSFPGLLIEEDRPLFQDVLERLAEGQARVQADVVHLSGNARSLAVRLTGSLRAADDNTTIVCIVLTDITKRVQAEDALRQMQKMEAIGTLAGGIAHDFNNILSAIIGFSEMSLEDIAEDHPAKHYAAQILRAATRGRDLVRQITVFSHRNEGERKQVRPGQIIGETLKLLRASLPSTIEIRERLETESGVIFASSTQIQQVIMNLCTNAGHAMKAKGGVLEVSLGPFDVDSAQESPCPGMAPGPYLRISVSDTGVGMPQEVLDRIFDPFFTTKSPSEGTGMGLAVVHRIVKSHGGAITVKSTPARGSLFDVYFPRVDVTCIDEAEAVIGSPAGSGRILLVDDEDAIVEMGTSVLKRLGYEVRATQDSLEALEIFRRDPSAFDLVITDQTMPRMTGTELTQELAALRSDIPVILCTGYSEIVDRDAAKDLGIREILAKPVSRNELTECIRRVLDDRAQGIR